MLFHDRLTLDKKARICADGSLVAEVKAARTGIQDYSGIEVDPDNELGLRDRAVVRVYRPAEEVFSKDSMASYAAAPVTVNHPAEMVDAGNWRDLGVGEINGDVVRDGECVRVPVIVRDAFAVSQAQTTHKQLSMGYSCTLDATPGRTTGGDAYDAVQRGIRINHIALVPAARGGPELRISDERLALPENQVMKIKIGDAEVDSTNGEAVRIAVDVLNTKLGALTAQVSTLSDKATALETASATKDGEIVALNAKLADAVVSPEKLQAMADARGDIIARAKTLLPALVADGKTDAAIRKEAVTAKIGDAAKDMADAAIEGAFVALTKDAKPTDTTFADMGLPKTASVSEMASFRDAARDARNAA